jgi:hypothetical protein
MKHLMISLLLAGGLIAWSAIEASAVVCARGVYRAGCVAAAPGVVVAPGAAVVVGRPVVRPVVVAPRRVVRRRVY